MIEVSIPSLEREVDKSGKLRKHFKVEILFNGRKHAVKRRQSEFLTLHRKLKKILQPPDFPSKRNQHLRTKPLEQRRQELEDYIQVILYQNEVVPQELLDFLQVKHFHLPTDVDSSECELLHHRVVGFSCDPYFHPSNSGLPDMVTAGVLQGIYPGNAKVSFRPCPKAQPTSLEPSPVVPAIVIDRSSPGLPADAQRT